MPLTVSAPLMVALPLMVWLPLKVLAVAIDMIAAGTSAPMPTAAAAGTAAEPLTTVGQEPATSAACAFRAVNEIRCVCAFARPVPRGRSR